MSETQKPDLTQDEFGSILTHHRLVKSGGENNPEAVREARQLEFQDGSGGIIKSLVRKLLSKDKREQAEVLKDPEFLKAVQERAQVEATVLRNIAYGVALKRIADEQFRDVEDVRYHYTQKSIAQRDEIIVAADYEKAMELMNEVLEKAVYNIDHISMTSGFMFTGHITEADRSLTKALDFKHWIRTGMTGEDAVNYHTDLDVTPYDQLLATVIGLNLIQMSLSR